MFYLWYSVCDSNECQIHIGGGTNVKYVETFVLYNISLKCLLTGKFSSLIVFSY